MYWLIACIGVSALNLLLIGHLIERVRLIETLLQLLSMENEAPEPADSMNLTLLKPKMKRKTRRFTDRSRDWITTHEKASRR